LRNAGSAKDNLRSGNQWGERVVSNKASHKGVVLPRATGVQEKNQRTKKRQRKKRLSDCNEEVRQKMVFNGGKVTGIPGWWKALGGRDAGKVIEKHTVECS